MSLTIGITAGFAAALGQALSYLFSRRYVQRAGSDILALLVTSHVLMGGASVVLLAVLWPKLHAVTTACLVPLAAATLFYLGGQASLFWALRRAEASRVAPLLGLKILVLAVLVTLFQGQVLGPHRWGAVALALLAAFLINETGGRIPGQAIVAVLCAVSSYSLSDLYIVELVKALKPLGPVWAPPVGVGLNYLLCGVCSLPLLFACRGECRRTWSFAVPYAAAWFGGIFCLFICFACIGVVYGNIIQSTRGLMAMALGWQVARQGLHQLESHVVPGVFWRRLAAALLMLGAVALYGLA